ncbi:hypothetical protein HAX54_032939, partial [Datura stramonium]|nr:hypothetical protein [Datura stramonium]
QMSVEKIEMTKIFSKLKSDCKVLKSEKIELENTNKTLKDEINKSEETISIQKSETSKLIETVSSLKTELITIKEGKTSSSDIITHEQGFLEAEINSLKRELYKEKKKISKLQ